MEISMTECLDKMSLSRNKVEELYQQPLLELVYRAARIHRQHHDPEKIQCSSLLSIKTGACSEDCGYCPQSAHHSTDVEREDLLDIPAVLGAARDAQKNGADRFCMGAAWRDVPDGPKFDSILQMVQGVKGLGLETCMTLGMVRPDQAEQLKSAGLDYYNHNLDTSREFYSQVVTTRTYDERLNTLAAIRDSGMRICCGGILGMGESEDDRISLLWELARQDPPPESVPINALIPVAGTPMAEASPLRWDELIRAVATARCLMPESVIRLSAGRESMTEEAQAFAFLAGANSIFLGDRLLTTSNPAADEERTMLTRLGLVAVSERTQTR